MRRYLLLTLMLTLAACAPRQITSSAPSTAAPLVAPRPVPAGFEQMVVLVNEVRGRGYDCGETGRFGAAPPVAWNERLAQAASVHNHDMSRNRFFDHVGSDGNIVGARLERQGYRWSLAGENLAYATLGHFDERSVVEAWLGSPGHCAVLMDPAFREIGAAKLETQFEFWTQVFAVAR